MNAKKKKTRPQRSAGILLHPTSLPGAFGIGDLGPSARAWVDALVAARQTWWQILPLGPTSFGDSPYQCFSAFAGNRYLISPEGLVQDGLIRAGDLGNPHFPADGIDFGSVIPFKIGLLSRAWDNFQSGAAAPLRGPFENFCVQEGHWLNDFALFMALKDAHNGASWQEWPRALVRRESGALREARRQLSRAVGLHQFAQFLFFRQWRDLKRYANDRGIRLMGDAPIFVASDSADVWANSDLFQLDKERQPIVVAGVPPDYFSATGQRWGNPLYDWEAIKKTGYAWWLARLRALLTQVDLVRLDHFRGFEAYWEIKADQPTAEHGRWIPGPGADFFRAVRGALGGLPLVAEDLGLITPEVEQLRDQFQLPGMRILQFANWGDPEDRFLPHNYEPNAVVYTGTHDNDTTVAWYHSLSDLDRHLLRRYSPQAGGEIAWDLIRLAWSSVADYALTPLQDLLSLGSEARMNLPGRPAGNWSWRFRADMLNPGLLDRLADLTEVYGRSPEPRH
jgi:4-alpha-glucanotransferase